MLRPRELSRSLSLFPAETPTLLPATHTNSYAVGARDLLLVEPATPNRAEQRVWLEWARSLPSQGRRAVAIVPTHHHTDHVGGVAVFSQELGLPVWAHAATRDRMTGAPVSRLLNDGDLIDLGGPDAEEWQVLHTPGHAPGHICLWNAESRTLVAGDMVASIGTILISPEDGDMAVYLEQLERLALLEPKLMLPAHGDPIDAPVALLRHYIAHRLARETKIIEAISRFKSGVSLGELVAVAYDDVPPHIWPAALLSLESHVKKLVAEGRARREELLIFPAV